MSKISHFEKEYFNGEKSILWKAGGYDLLVRLNMWRLRKFRKIIKKYSTSHKTLLDVGCGYGSFLTLFKNDFNIYGMDISHHAIEVAKIRLDCPVQQANIENEFPYDKKFDIITAIDVIEHLNNPRIAIQNIYNHLNEEGLFCFQLPTVNNGLSNLINKLFFAHDKTHIFIVSVEELENLIKSVGFKKIAIYSSLFPIFTKKLNFVKDFCTIFGLFKKF